MLTHSSRKTREMAYPSPTNWPTRLRPMAFHGQTQTQPCCLHPLSASPKDIAQWDILKLKVWRCIYASLVGKEVISANSCCRYDSALEVQIHNVCGGRDSGYVSVDGCSNELRYMIDRLGHGDIEDEGRAMPLRVETMSMLRWVVSLAAKIPDNTDKAFSVCFDPSLPAFMLSRCLVEQNTQLLCARKG